MKRLSLIILFMFLSTSFNLAYGEIYRWTDDEGNPQISNRLDKVPAKYRDSVTVRESGKPTNTSQSNKDKAPKKATGSSSGTPIANEDLSYDGKSLNWWLKTIEDINKEIEAKENIIESKKLILESHESTVDYSRDLTRQIKELKQRLKVIRAWDAKTKDEKAKKNRDIIYLTKQLKRVNARKNANVVKDEKKDAIETSGKEIAVLEQELIDLKIKLETTMNDARKAGVTQKHFYEN